MLHLLRSVDIVLEIANSMLPCLEALREELGDLANESDQSPALENTFSI